MSPPTEHYLLIYCVTGSVQPDASEESLKENRRKENGEVVVIILLPCTLLQCIIGSRQKPALLAPSIDKDAIPDRLLPRTYERRKRFYRTHSEDRNR